MTTNIKFNLEMVNMNMIVSTSDLVGYEAEKTNSTQSARKEALNKLVSLWEKKAASTKRAGAFGMIAVSLAACNSDDDSDATAALQSQLTAALAAQASAEAATAAAEAATAAAAAAPAAAAVPVAVGGGVLTTGIDSVVAATTNDNVTAGLTAGVMTLQSLDAINTGAGTDTLTAIVTGAVTPALTGVESLTFSNSTNAGTVDLSNSSGYTSILNTGSSVLLSVTNISDTATEMTYANSGSGSSFDFTAAAKLGTTTAATVNINNTTGGNLTMTGVELLTVNSIGQTNNVALAAGATSLTITGDQTTTLTGNQTATTIDASAATGSVTVTSVNSLASTLTGGPGANTFNVNPTAAFIETVSGGAGNDTIDFVDNLANTDVVTGGDGTDTLRSDDVTITNLTKPAAGYNISGFETIYVDDSLGVNLNTANVVESGITLIRVLSTTGARTITNTESAFTFRTDGNLANTLVLTDGTGVAIDNHVTLTNGTTTATNNSYNGQSITLTGIETLTIDTTGLGVVANTVGTVAFTADTGGEETLNVIGADAITIATFDGNILDASTMSPQATGTNTLTMTNGSTSAVTITGSPGDDSIRGDAGGATVGGGLGNDAVFGGAGNDTLTGGGGNDSITMGAGTDNVDGGAGNDTVITADADLSSGDVVAGGDGTDTLVITEAAGFTAAESGSVSGFEILRADQAVTQAMTDIVGTNAFTTVTQSDASGNLVITNASAALQTITMLEGTNNNNTITFSRLVGAGTADTLTLSGSTTKDVRSLTVTTSDVESLTVTANGATNGTGDLTIDTLSATALTTLTITGTNDVIISAAITGATSLATVDSTGLSTAGVADVDASNSISPVTMTSGDGGSIFTGGMSNDTITGGAAVDTLVGGNGVDTMNGGGGADEINGGAGNDVLTGGGGSDDFNFSTVSSATELDSITDLALGGTSTTVDQIDVSAWDTATIGQAITNDTGVGGAVNSVALASAGAAATTVDVLILDTGSFVNAAGAEIAQNTNSANANTDMILVWQDTSGLVHVAVDEDRDTNGGANTDDGIYDIFTLPGMSLASVALGLDGGDFII
jgi:hypothetical protein